MKLSFVSIIGDGKAGRNTGWLKEIFYLASLGYDGVELAVRDPGRIDVYALARALIKYGLEVSAIGTGLAYIEDRLSLSSPDNDIKDCAVKRVEQHIDLASRFDAQVILGLIRGKLPGYSADLYLWKRCYKNLLESTERLCEYAVKKNVRLTLEPINRYETSFLNTADETIDFINKIGFGNLKMMLDTFHMNIEERDFSKTILNAKKYISHVHFSDSNRRYPGAGHIDFVKIVKALKGAGYDSYVSGEIMVDRDFRRSAKTFITNTKGYFRNARI